MYKGPAKTPVKTPKTDGTRNSLYRDLFAALCKKQTNMQTIQGQLSHHEFEQFKMYKECMVQKLRAAKLKKESTDHFQQAQIYRQEVKQLSTNLSSNQRAIAQLDKIQTSSQDNYVHKLADGVSKMKIDKSGN